MPVQWAALASFVLVTSFTPGPNNISAMSVGVSVGYRRSLGFLAGIAVGFVVVMCLCALIATLLVKSLPIIEPFLRIAGSLYIVWLAIQTLRGSLKADRTSARSLRFLDGLTLQILNVKVIVYGLTLYSTFLQSIAGQGLPIALSAITFAAVGFASISAWNLAGTTFSRLFTVDGLRKVLAAVLSLMLLYSAVESSGVMKILAGA